jgi:preprotein translocase subunit SecG
MYLVILHAIRMFGMSMVFMPVSTNGLNQLPPRFYPHGTAMNNTLQQVSAAIGTAFLITVMSTRSESYGKELSASAMQNNMSEQQIAMSAMLEGINYSFFVATLISAIAFVLSFFIKRAKPAEDKREENQSKPNEQLLKKLAKS